MFQESVRLSTGLRLQQCAPCSIIFRMKLIMPVFRARWQCLRPTCQEILFCQCATAAKIFIQDFWTWLARLWMSSFESETSGFLRWGLCFVVLHPPHAKIFTMFFFCSFSFLFFFVSTKYYLRQITFAVAWTVVKPFSKEPTADLLLQFPFQPPTLIPGPLFLFLFCQDKAAFQLSHNPFSIYLLLSNCDLSLCWSLASMWTPAKSMD